ncbi:Uncharacterized protein TCM_021755 [Theobroma cacao]|uniref:Uncharacterized protein n=1 Tax=Theobroma cacao TaxID=3641 RepID=A0A061EQI0_THECC|nr:Uncharacterized protein TCM_021755 [Theobroma cacao]
MLSIKYPLQWAVASTDSHSYGGVPLTGKDGEGELNTANINPAFSVLEVIGIYLLYRICLDVIKILYIIYILFYNFT